MMLFPGITRVYLKREDAIAYLTEPTSTGGDGEKKLMVLFEIKIDTSHPGLSPMNVQKFLGENPLDDEHFNTQAKCKNMADGLM